MSDVEIWTLGTPDPSPFWAAVEAWDKDGLVAVFRTEGPVRFAQGGALVGERALRAEEIVNELIEEGRLYKKDLSRGRFAIGAVSPAEGPAR